MQMVEHPVGCCMEFFPSVALVVISSICSRNNWKGRNTFVLEWVNSGQQVSKSPYEILLRRRRRCPPIRKGIAGKSDAHFVTYHRTRLLQWFQRFSRLTWLLKNCKKYLFARSTYCHYRCCIAADTRRSMAPTASENSWLSTQMYDPGLIRWET